MAKYRKEKSVARVRKKKVFETKAIQSNEQLGYVDALSRVAIQTKLQEALEAERDEIVGRAWHAHHRGDGPRDYRNGYGDPRSLTCGCGTVEIQMPRTRQGYASGMVGKYERLTPAMKNLLPELYLHGLATGDFEPAFGWLWGEDAPLSTSTIVRLKQQWEKEYDQWKDRPLEKEYLYLWADGIYPKGGPIDETLALLVVVGVNRRGEKQLLAIEEGYRESEDSWRDVFRNLKRRGVEWIGLVTGDGIAGLWKALRSVFPLARHQRCWVHKMRNILDKVPKKVHDEVLTALRKIYYASSYKEAQHLKQEFVRQYRSSYPKAVKSFEEPGDSLFAYFRFPAQHWKSIKTTNPIESLFSTVRLRTRAARRLRNRMATVCLVFQLLKHSEKRLNRLGGYKLIEETIDTVRSQQLKTKKRLAA